MSTDFTDHEQDPAHRGDRQGEDLGWGAEEGESPLDPQAGAPEDQRLQSATPSPPTTEDPEIDRALEELAAAQTGSLAERIAAGEQAQSALQSRLRDLGGA
jgi:hypothetical protein